MRHTLTLNKKRKRGRIVTTAGATGKKEIIEPYASGEGPPHWIEGKVLSLGERGQMVMINRQSRADAPRAFNTGSIPEYTFKPGGLTPRRLNSLIRKFN